MLKSLIMTAMLVNPDPAYKLISLPNACKLVAGAIAGAGPNSINAAAALFQSKDSSGSREKQIIAMIREQRVWITETEQTVFLLDVPSNSHELDEIIKVRSKPEVEPLATSTGKVFYVFVGQLVC
ncbi:hypothetical protein SAMN02744133_10854 [Thalassospira xiamenensis M-5 = DSM 17429]|uniref:Uncharacterized protein n=1 Tax=Thalassospira xiamenensis M-5 = DSM 17429 TaxID=1123366 RepID=A0AB72UJG5_9PROT|nr:hypothetical protein [Thalassospira xiamenensis]AJD54333.1 hypothetical protein TH3_21303 [Thalassospira xiamenensis M-5 = DSM 17429]SIT21242.1 hypothetical protein SAMN02744133_10854 [Thalassospira xiamenensis M-5 = DSM 17429]